MAVDPYRYFRIEARELLGQLGAGVLALERGAADGGLLAQLRRDAHTLKGAARVVRLVALADEAHALEDLLTDVREGEAPHEGTTERMLSLVDAMGARLAELATPQPGAADAAGSRPAAPPDVSPRERPEELSESFQPEAADIDAVARGLSSADVTLGHLHEAVRGIDDVRRLVEVLDEQLARAGSRGMPGGGQPAHAGLRAIAGDVSRRLTTVARDGLQAVERASRDVRQALDAAATLRLSSARGIARFLERAARDAAQAQGKRVRFSAVGVDLRLEPDMLGVMQRALLHLVRNAVVHGVEPDPEVRRALGKPAEATVTVTVERAGSHVRFSCTDDGGGIDLERVRQAMIRRGDSVPAAADSDTLLRMLLDSGVSTAPTVTSLAGRGVGMDVVRDAAARLGGRVEVRTRPGEGTTVIVVVPFALASMPALLVEAGGVPAAVPMDAVSRAVRLEERDLVHEPRGVALMLDGRSVPVTSLDQVLAPGARTSVGPARTALVLRSGERTAAIIVDRIVHAATITVRPLPDLAPAGEVVAGAAVDPAGRPRLVLDAEALVHAAGVTRPETQALSAGPTRILVVDDSLTTRMLEQSVLEAAGYAVDLASSGEEGLEKAAGGAYALMLVDVEMPGIDGFTFVERVKSDARLGTTPVILVTSRNTPEDRARGRSAGADAYIVKSEFDQHGFLGQVRSLIAR